MKTGGVRHAKELAAPEVMNLPDGGVPLVEDIVGGDRTSERECPAQRGGRLDPLAKVDLGPEQRLARLAILDALARKPTPSPVTDAGLPGVWTPASGACLCTDMHVSA